MLSEMENENLQTVMESMHKLKQERTDSHQVDKNCLRYFLSLLSPLTLSLSTLVFTY